jgi:hypothetical protein
LREAEVWIAQGETAGKICRGAGISEQTCCNGGLKIDQAKRLKELERENERLKRHDSTKRLATGPAARTSFSPDGWRSCRRQVQAIGVMRDQARDGKGFSFPRGDARQREPVVQARIQPSSSVNLLFWPVASGRWDCRRVSFANLRASSHELASVRRRLANTISRKLNALDDFTITFNQVVVGSIPTGLPINSKR